MVPLWFVCAHAVSRCAFALHVVAGSEEKKQIVHGLKRKSENRVEWLVRRAHTLPGDAALLNAPLVC
jgi:hypothetical protein